MREEYHVNMKRVDYIYYYKNKYIKGLHGLPDFDIYKNTKPDDWYWKENSKKEENMFLWWDQTNHNSDTWR